MHDFITSRDALCMAISLFIRLINGGSPLPPLASFISKKRGTFQTFERERGAFRLARNRGVQPTEERTEASFVSDCCSTTFVAVFIIAK